MGVGSSYLFFRFLLGEEKLGWTEILLEAASSISSNGRWVLDRVQAGAGAGVALRQLWRHLSSAQTTANNFHTTKFILSTAAAAAAATDETNTTISLYSAPQQNLPGYPQQLLKLNLHRQDPLKVLVTVPFNVKMRSVFEALPVPVPVEQECIPLEGVGLALRRK